MTLVTNATSADLILSYSSTILTELGILTLPIIMAGGFGENDIMKVDKKEQVKTSVGADGRMITWFVASIVTGTITFQPTSPEYQQFITVMKAIENSKACISGTLIAASPSGGWTNVYNDFYVTSKFVGYSAGQKLNELEIDFSASSVGTANVAVALNSLTDIASLTNIF